VPFTVELTVFDRLANRLDGNSIEVPGS
jgi:hypothetical protein